MLVAAPTCSLTSASFPRPVDLPGVLNVADGCDIGAVELMSAD